jgi:hypothetical protein
VCHFQIAFEVKLLFFLRRIFDKSEYNDSATAVVPDGIAAYADWVIVSHSNSQCSIFGTTLRPQIVFLLRNAIGCFMNQIHPHMHNTNSSYVLITASNDLTLPVNLDKRFGFLSEEFIELTWNKLLWDPQILHMFVENLSVKHFKVSALPIGTWKPFKYLDVLNHSKPFQERAPKLFVSDRVHNGHIQFQDRVSVARACQEQLTDICVHIEQSHGSRETVPEGKWAIEVAKHQFHLCVHGGGHDTSPKSWETMLFGTIPIMERNALEEAYLQLPVAMVDNITDFVLYNPNKVQMMEQWVKELGPYYKDPLSPNSLFQKVTLPRLKVSYWYRRIISQIPNYRVGYLL